MKRIEMKLHNACLVPLITFLASVTSIASVAPAKPIRTHRMGTLNSRGSITVHAAGRGNPWMNLIDGREVLPGYTGAAELQQVLEQNLARPLALASADFDDDGVPSRYAAPGGGITTLHRGNVDSIYSNAPQA